MKSIFTKFKSNQPPPTDSTSSSIKNYLNPKKFFIELFKNSWFSRKTSGEKSLTRYIEEVKVEKSDKMTIIKSYDTFSRIIFSLIIVWTVLNVFSITRSQIVNFKEKAEVKAGIIERSVTNVVSMVDNYSSYVGEKILLLDGNKDKKIIASILKKNSNQNFITKNIYSWLDIDYVNSDGKLAVTSAGGVLPEPVEISDSYPISQSIIDKTKFKIGNVIHIVSSIADYDVIPVALSIYDEDKLKGVLISRIIVDQIGQTIESDLGDKDISYMVLTANYEVVAKSKDSENLKNIDEIKNNDEIKAIFNKFGFNKKNAALDKPIAVENATYRYYRQSDYPFLILVGYSSQIMIKSFLWELANALFQSVGVALLFLTTLHFFRKVKIIPVIQQLIDSRKQSEAASIAKSRFLSNMSHELRTPMSGIIGMSQDLKDNKNLSYEQRDQVTTIYRSADALLSILNDIVDFSKIESRRMALEKANFNLHILVEDVADLMSKSASEKNLEVLIYVDNKIPKNLIGDSGKIRQILINLVGNAIKFTHNGYVFINVTLQSAEEEGYWVNLTVEDSGIGIKEADKSNLFSRFNQADTSATRKFDGVGLGLAICEKLTKLMGGEVGLSSVFGNGSKFWIHIPLLKSPEKYIETHAKEDEQLRSKKVVIVDSSELGSRILKNRLKEIFDIEAFYPEIYGWDKSSKDKFDLALSFLKEHKDCDAIMLGYLDEFDVVEFADALRKDPNFTDKPLIMMATIRNRVKIPAEKLKLFISGLSKPIKENNLATALFLACGKFDYNNVAPIDTPKKVLPKIPYKILLVEDNHLNIKVAVMVLNRMGMEVDVAENGEEGLNKFLAGKYDLIFMDCMMPVMDGYEATKKIRAYEKQNKVIKLVPIIALTADATAENKESCFNCGMSDFITKPIIREVIEQVIAKWVNMV